MKNIDKYPNTKDALEAYQARDKGMFTTFSEWCEDEYKDSKPLTLLEALRTAKTILLPVPLNNFQLAGYRKIIQAIDAEDARPKRNYERFATMEEAYSYFNRKCNESSLCNLCIRWTSRKNGLCMDKASCFANWLDMTYDPFIGKEMNDEDIQ